MEQFSVQRKTKRYLAQDRTLARMNTSPEVLFHIIDISSGGLAFRYLGDDELESFPTEIDILYDEKFTLTELPVQPVADCVIEYGYLPMRRKCFRFGSLTPWQKAELEHFLANYTAAVLQ
jgi:hypothetical protein